MGLFSKAEVTVLKESSDAKTYLSKLEGILPQATEKLKDKIQKEIAITKAGIYGEDNILFELKNSGMDMVVLHDIYIETADGRGAQIDFIVVTSGVTLVIECKNLFGNIEIDSKGDFIRTIEINGHKIKEGIYSPITQNERHMTVLNDRRKEDKGLLGKIGSQYAFDKYYRSVVVLANPKTVVYDRYAKRETKEKVIRADQLINYIKDANSTVSIVARSSKSEMMNIAQSLLDKNIEERKDYFVKFENLLSEVKEEQAAAKNTAETVSAQKSDSDVKKTDLQKDDTSENKTVNAEQKLICPKCGGNLVLRTAKSGDNKGNQFYGCSNYPKCRFIMNVQK